MTFKIYLDNNATTQLDPEVALVIEKDLRSPPSNPSSVHSFGREAKVKLLKARTYLASFFGVKAQEVLFTSSGTESMSLLLKGLIDPKNSPHILTSNIEHSCVHKTLLELESKGCKVSFLPAESKGFVSLSQIQEALTPETKFLVFSAANSETGVKIDLKEIADFAQSHNLALLIDGVAQLGKDPFPLYPGILGAGFSAHKFHGPKGVGFILLRSNPKFRLTPLFMGGGQEYGLRSGTENLTGILALEEALRQVEIHLPVSFKEMLRLRNKFESHLSKNFPALQINGSGERVCNVSNLCFPGIDAETLLIQLDLYGIAASQGSACSSGALEPSRILTNMGLSQVLARSSIRFSLSRFTTEKEIDRALDVLLQLIPKLIS